MIPSSQVLRDASSTLNAVELIYFPRHGEGPEPKFLLGFNMNVTPGVPFRVRAARLADDLLQCFPGNMFLCACYGAMANYMTPIQRRMKKSLEEIERVKKEALEKKRQEEALAKKTLDELEASPSKPSRRARTRKPPKSKTAPIEIQDPSVSTENPLPEIREEN